MEEDLAKDMSNLLFARSGVSLSPEELQSLQAAIRRKMGQTGDIQTGDVMDIVEVDSGPTRDVQNVEEIESLLKAQIDLFLSGYDSQMEQLALDQIQIPLWTPEFPDIDTDLRKFIWDLKIPRARAPNDHIPDMLLHKLGRFQKNESLRNRLTGLLGTKNHKAFVNTSGSGKTRMILEHLCSRWGIYLTCHEESRVGSSDLMMAISLIEQRLVDIPQPAILQVTTQQLAEFNDTQGVVCTEQQCLQERFNGNSLLPTFKSSSEGKKFRRALEANHQVVTSELLIVILARLAILRQFASTLHRMGKDTNLMSHKRQ